MKFSNIILLISVLSMTQPRIQTQTSLFTKQIRRLENNPNIKIVNNLNTRASKSQKMPKRKLISGTGFGGLTGAAGLGLMYVGVGEQKKEIMHLKMSLETQRMHLGREEVERNSVLNQISVHIDETFDKFDNYRSSLVSKIDEFNTFIQSKLKPYGMGLIGLKNKFGGQ